VSAPTPRGSVAVVLLLVISAPGIAIHVTPFGPVGLALSIVALVSELRRAAGQPVLIPPAVVGLRRPIAPRAQWIARSGCAPAAQPVR
jgi:hypothetical protein